MALGRSGREALAGGAAGCATVLALHPLDVVRTRLQVQDGVATPVVFRGTAHAFRLTVAQEGFGGLYRGLTTALVGSTLSWALYFAAYDRAKARWLPNEAPIGAGGEPPVRLQAWQHLVSAAEAGAVVSLLTNPLWVVKTRLQVQRDSSVRYNGLVHTLGRIAREEGLRGLYQGIGPSLLLVSHGAVQFMAYEELKGSLLGWRERDHLNSVEAGALGVASKLVAAVLTYPAQVLRSRLQQRASGPGAPAYAHQGLVSALATIARREGVVGLYRGMVPNVLRVLPSSAMTFLVYERVNAALAAAAGGA